MLLSGWDPWGWGGGLEVYNPIRLLPRWPSGTWTCLGLFPCNAVWRALTLLVEMASPSRRLFSNAVIVYLAHAEQASEWAADESYSLRPVFLV